LVVGEVKVTKHCATRFLQRRLELGIALRRIPSEVREQLDKAIVTDWNLSKMFYEEGNRQFYLKGDYIYVVAKGKAILTMFKRIPGNLDASLYKDVRDGAGLSTPQVERLSNEPRKAQIDKILRFCEQVQKWANENNTQHKKSVPPKWMREAAV
jgi:hypothetical protein